jgi:Predicted integral membrane protein
MNCSQIKKKLSAFMDDELDGATSRFITEHLKDCPRCREYLHEFRKIANLVNELPRNDPSPDFFRRVVKAAIGTSKIVDEKPVPFSSYLRFALERLSEEIFNLIPSGSPPNIRTLEEFGDCPPLSMSFIYFRLLEQPKQRIRIST